MAILSLNRIAWQYHALSGATYRVAAQSAVTVQAKQGGEAWAGTAGPLYNDVLRMRRITVRSAAQGVSRVVPLYEDGAALATVGETINLNHLADSYPFTSDGNPLPEERVRHSVTRQNA